MREGSWQVPGLGARHEATLVAKLVPGGLSDPSVFSPRRRQLLAALGPCSCAVPAASRQRLRQSMQLAPHQPSDHEEQLFATAPIDPDQTRVQSNPHCLFAHLGKRASESKRRILLQRHSKRGCTGRRFRGRLRSAAPWPAKFAFDFGLSDTRMLASLNWNGNDLSPPCQDRASFVQKCHNHVIIARERIAVGTLARQQCGALAESWSDSARSIHQSLGSARLS